MHEEEVDIEEPSQEVLDGKESRIQEWDNWLELFESQLAPGNNREDLVVPQERLQRSTSG